MGEPWGALGSILRFLSHGIACMSRFFRTIPTLCFVLSKGCVSVNADQFEVREDGQHNNTQLAPLQKISVQCTEVISSCGKTSRVLYIKKCPDPFPKASSSPQNKSQNRLCIHYSRTNVFSQLPRHEGFSNEQNLAMLSWRLSFKAQRWQTSTVLNKQQIPPPEILIKRSTDWKEFFNISGREERQKENKKVYADRSTVWQLTMYKVHCELHVQWTKLDVTQRGENDHSHLRKVREPRNK